MKDGVIYVYNDAAAADKHQPKDLPCPDYDTFIDDMNFLIALIAQGPTWVALLSLFKMRPHHLTLAQFRIWYLPLSVDDLLAYF